MPLEIITVPCLSDNYAFLIHASETNTVAVVDVPEANPIQHELEKRNWTLTDILITHHHDDHIAGVESLQGATGARVHGAVADTARLPPLDKAYREGDTIDFVGGMINVVDVPGHTVGHIAFHLPAANAVFTADSLMALGCGRLFEGTPDQMWSSLSKLNALPDDTIVYSGHEYTAANARFALTIEPDNPDLIARVAAIKTARAAGKPTVPSSLALERATNPFLRAALPAVKASLNMSSSPDAAVFAEIRQRKDRF